MSDSVTPFPPFAEGSSTSAAAAQSVAAIAASMREMVFELIQVSGENGLTCNEIENVLSMKHQTASARVWELRKEGRIVPNGKRRLTDSKRTAAAMVTLEFAPTQSVAA